MKHSRAIRLAVEALQAECKRLAVNANFHDMMGLDAPACVAASERRKELRAAIKELKQPQQRAMF